MTLHVAPASHAAMRYACTRWHYARCVPVGRLARFGCWDDGRYYGAIVYGHGATPNTSAPFDVHRLQVCELVRVALDDGHPFPVTRAVAVTLRILKRTSPDLRVVVSFADTGVGHRGAIYQAGNWLYLGAPEAHRYRVHGRIVHPRTLGITYGPGGQSVAWLREHVDPHAERIATAAKHKYVYPLDDTMRAQLTPLALPYPRAGSADSGTPANHAGRGGAIPTPALT